MVDRHRRREDRTMSEREDEDELRKLAYRYAHMIDRRKWDLIPRVFTGDADLTGPGFAMSGHEELAGGLPSIDQFSATLHCVHNHLVHLEGDKGTGETYCVANHIYEKEGVPYKLDMGIRYDDHYLRTAEGWRIQNRVLNCIWQQDLPLELGGAGAKS